MNEFLLFICGVAVGYLLGHRVGYMHALTVIQHAVSDVMLDWKNFWKMTDDLFHILNDVQVILASRGVFYQRKVFYRGDRLYAQHGGGFVRLGQDDATSAPHVSWNSLDIPEHMRGRVKQAKFQPPMLTI